MMSGQEPLTISVVIPTYNMAHVIGDTIKSVLNQSYGNFEIIVQDNDSQDNTATVIRSFADPRIKYFKNSANLGYAKNLIAGWKNCTGDILYFLGADDVLSKNALKETSAAFMRDENIGAVTRSYFWFQGSTEHIRTPIRVTPILNEHQDETIDIHNIQKAMYVMHNEILGQLSGLAFRIQYLQESFFTRENNWIAHGYPFLHIFKKHPVVFLKNHQVAVRIGENTIRQKGNTFYLISPTKRWIEMLDEILYEDEFKELKTCFIKKIIASNYVGLVQIKSYAGMYFLLREIGYLLKYRISNILSVRFWFFSLGSIVVPGFLLGRMADYYKNRINSKIMKEIHFEYDLSSKQT
ncbi:MAG: glycosyltransferase family 2 protein [Candidatus Moranbacteria bacterium]|nr:glycosyltransferase family 2 protein [Candidatus Moranbacteria bacterium]